MTIEEGPCTSEWIKSNEEEETKILQLKDKKKDFASLHQKYHKFTNFLKLMWMPKISNKKTKHDLYENVINKN
jgi:hypothetical protein